MDAHKSVLATPPIHMLRDIVSRMEPVSFGDGHSPHSKLLKSAATQKFKEHYDRRETKRLMDALFGSGPQTPKKFMRTLFRELALMAERPIVFIKENQLAQHGAQIIDAFPDARFVFQVRDPRDFIASGLALRDGALGNKFGSFGNALSVWHEDQSFGLRMLGHFGAERVFLQRYEDLIQDPETVLKSLCEFLSILFDPGMLSFYEMPKAQKDSTRNRALENISKPIMKQNSRKYLNSLSEEQIVDVEAHVGLLMDRFGYERHAKLSPQMIEDAISRVSKNEPIERAANDEWTPFYLLQSKQHHSQLDDAAAPLEFQYGANEVRARVLPQSPKSRDASELGLSDLLLEAANKYADLPALKVAGVSYTYETLFYAVRSQAAALRNLFAAQPDRPPVVAVWATRTASSYVAILATVLAGGTYVPLSCRSPLERNRDILLRTHAMVLLHASTPPDNIVDLIGGTEVLDTIPVELLKCGRISNFLAKFGKTAEFVSRKNSPEDINYILFTSGSTGTPKGVPIRHRNLLAYLIAARNTFEPGPQDRLSQTFDLTFDLAMHDIFLALTSGAQLCIPSDFDLKMPGQYIERDKITCWFSVPYLGHVIQRQGGLSAGALSNLRCSFFCGEALPASIVRDWSIAAPNSQIENWYGPTEATVACLRYACDDNGNTVNDASLLEIGGIVPIGAPLGETQILVLDDELQELENDSIGRLFVSGPQIAAGYLNAPELTAEKFLKLPNHDAPYYDTGDLVRRVDQTIHFVGRSDSQLKLRGFRIELGEIENALRKTVGDQQVVVLSWPPAPEIPTHLIGVIEDSQNVITDAVSLREKLREELPLYMIPANILKLNKFAVSTSGKVDRKAIIAEVELLLAAKQKEVGVGEYRRLDQFETDILDLILSIRPSLDRSEVSRAPSLIWAGLDSADLMTLMLILEQEFNLELEIDDVAAISVMRFDQIVSFLKSGGDLEVDIFRDLAPSMVGRAQRTFEFIDAIPEIVRESKKPIVLAFGSSGTMRGFRADVADCEAATLGLSVTTLSAGLPGISVQGLSRICRYIADTCRAENVKLAGVLYELDPMMVSTQPPTGDIMLAEAQFSGATSISTKGSLMPEYRWEKSTQGDVTFTAKTAKKRKRAKWENERDFTVDDVYHGRVPFDSKRTESWLEGFRHLQSVSERVAIFAHPLQAGKRLQDQDRPDGALYDDLLAHVTSATRGCAVLTDVFDLPPELFLNINHMEPLKGSTVFTEQLIRKLFAT